MSKLAGVLRLIAAVVLTALSWLAWDSPAFSWPDRPVKFIVPLGAGSGVDISARMFADRLSPKWGKPVVIENRPGGDSIIAIKAFTSANEDHTLLFAPSGSFTAHPYLYPKLTYDPGMLSPVARVTSTIVVLAVPASSKARTIADLVRMIRGAPGQLNWATATSLNDFLFAGYLKQSGLSMTKIPYRDTVSAINDLAEGRIDAYIGAYAIVRPQVQAGKVRVLAVTNRERASSAPDIPTAKEAGFPELGFDGLTGLFGPPTMASDVRDRIAADIKAAAADPDVISRLTATGQVIVPGSATQFAAAINEQRAQIDAVGRTLGIRPAR